MADRRFSLVFYGAILVALVATYGVYVLLERTKESNRIATAPIVVALSDVPEGGLITRTMLTTEQWPVAAIPATAFRSVDSVSGRVARIPFFKGEAVLEGRLAPVGTGPGLEIKITPGKRAMAVRINDVAGISGLIQPNSRVDVLLTMAQGSERTNQVAKLFMENMRVLSVGTQVERGQDGKPIHATTATLEVSPDEAERLAVAISQGQIQLVLRGFGDPDSVSTRGASTADVMAQVRAAPTVQPPAPRAAATAPARRPAPAPPVEQPRPVLTVAPPPARPESTTVRVFRGTNVSQQKFEKDSVGRSVTP